MEIENISFRFLYYSSDTQLSLISLIAIPGITPFGHTRLHTKHFPQARTASFCKTDKLNEVLQNTIRSRKHSIVEIIVDPDKTAALTKKVE